MQSTSDKLEQGAQVTKIFDTDKQFSGKVPVPNVWKLSLFGI